MKVRKNSIHLSSLHPSLCVNLTASRIPIASLVINADGILIDGYRRFQISLEDEIEIIEMGGDLFETALSLNLRTRRWEEADCFLWTRWARALGADPSKLEMHQFSSELFDADLALIEALANEQINFRQFVFLCRTPSRHRAHLLELLTQQIQLNANETAVFVDSAVDLLQILGLRNMHDLFQNEILEAVLENPALNLRQKGEKLLKEMRALRYPYYTKKLKEFSSNWGQLKINPGIQVKKNLFIERGILDISFTANSQEELKTKVSDLHTSLTSPHWKKIWEQ